MSEHSSGRYPGYDVLSKRRSPSWNEQTRQVIDRRLAISRTPEFFTPDEWQTLAAICARILPQPADRPPVPLPVFVDQKLASKSLDGYRYAALPPQDQAWRRGLEALDEDALQAHGQRFHLLPAAAQDGLLGRMQRGELSGGAWGDMPSRTFFEQRVIPDITHAYYAHPVAWSEIGFGGPAGPRGYVRMGLDRRDPWEAAEADGANDAAVSETNRHVG